LAAEPPAGFGPAAAAEPAGGSFSASLTFVCAVASAVFVSASIS